MIDKRDSPPAGYTAEEYGAKVASRLPMSSLTRRDSYCLKDWQDEYGEWHEELGGYRCSDCGQREED